MAGELGITAAGDALRSQYKDGLISQINELASPTVQKLEKTSESVEGTDIVLASRYGRSGGVGNRSDIGTLPTPNPRKTKQIKYPTKNIYARANFSDKLIAASKTSVASFCRMMEQTIGDLEVDARESFARQLFGDGTGLLATIATGGVAGSVLTLDTVVGLYEGMLIDSFTAGAVAHDTAMEVTVVDEENTKITVTGLSTTVAADLLYTNGNKDMELTGLKAWLRPGATLVGVTLADFPFFKSLCFNLNAELSEVAIQKQIDNARRRIGSKINWINCSDGVKRGFFNLLIAQKRQVNSRTLDGGFEVLSYNGVDLVGEVYQRAGVMQFMDLSQWALHQMGEWDWMDRDGAVLHRMTDKPVYEATFFKYADLGCKTPRGQVEMYGITEH